MKSLHSNLLLVGLVLFPTLTFASQLAPVTEVRQEGTTGFSELGATAEGIVGTYSHKVGQVRIETRRGRSTVAVDRRQDPGAPLYEIDVRITDETGYPFFLQFGGHGPIDDSWTKSETVFGLEAPVPSDEKATANFQAAERALEEIVHLRFVPEWREEHRTLGKVLAAIREGVAMDTMKPIDEYVAAASTCNYRHKLSVYKGTCCWNGLTGAEHSATRATNVSASGAVTQIWSALNHGRAYSDSTMSFYDSWESAANRCAMGTVSTPAKCATEYSRLGRCGTHVCNDDSITQCDSLKTLSTPVGLTGTCSDCTLRLKAPRCD